MNEHKDEIKVSLNLNELILKYVDAKLDEFAARHPKWKTEILCDLPKLCRDICLTILHYLWKNNVKKHKTKTAEICCIHRDTVRNYEKYEEP